MATTSPVMFDAHVMVDWSAANVPRTGRDSIWICWRGAGGERLDNPPTRREAKALLYDRLRGALARGERVLLGFDFPFGYPAGFAARLGLGGTAWRAVWDEIARLIEDDDKNRSNRFEVAAALNRRISNRALPFWGCPAKQAGDYLAPTRPCYDETGLAERRLIDDPRYMPGAQPCWKLAYPGSVGSQVLTGIPIVRALRNDPDLAERARIWPFETGLRAPEDPGLVFAEVYPSLWRKAIAPIEGEAQGRRSGPLCRPPFCGTRPGRRARPPLCRRSRLERGRAPARRDRRGVDPRRHRAPAASDRGT